MKPGLTNIVKRIILPGVIFFISTYSSCDKNVTLTSPPEPIPQASLYINSIPAGSTIFVNEKNTGRVTPDSLPFIDEGTYQITLKKDYFRDTSFVMMAVENEKRSITVNYLSNPTMLGAISFKSAPTNSMIFMNDSSINQVTPFILKNLLPGEYNISFKKENYRDVNFLASVESNKTSNVFLFLQDTSIWVDYKSTNSEIQSDFLTAVVLDKRGVKWIGTSNLGLIRYDSKSFIILNTDNSMIPGNSINSISVDAQNRIWVCTNNGIGVYDGVNWINYNMSNTPLRTNNINVVRFDNNGAAWIGTPLNLARFDGVNWRNYELTSGEVESPEITDIAFINGGGMWLATSKSGLIKFDGDNTFKVYKSVYYNILTNSISALGLEQNGDLWILNNSTKGVRGGVTLLRGEEFITYPLGESTIVPRSVFIDNNNVKWIATNEGMLTINNSMEFNIMNGSSSGLPSNNLFQVSKQNDGTVWIASYGGGLIKYKGAK